MPDTPMTSAARRRPNVVMAQASCPCGSRLSVSTVDGAMEDLLAVNAWLDRHAEPHPRAWGQEASGAT